MKKIVVLFVSALAVFSVQKAFAQDEKYGPNAENCKNYLSFYETYWKQSPRNYNDALVNWRLAYSICPATASENMFIRGSALMAYEYNRVKDPVWKAAIVDTILVLQDQRMATYPKKRVDILNNKGVYLVKYRGSDTRYIYDNLAPIIDELGPKAVGNAQINLQLAYFDAAIALYREQQLGADEVIALYEKVSGNVNGFEAKNDAEAAENQKVKNTLESHFADSKVASCDNLVAIFGPRFEANPEDIALVSNIVRLMSEDCAGEDLYLKAVTAMHKLDPSIRSAYGLYKLNASRGNNADAAAYLQQAIDSEESDAVTDAQYSYELAAFCYKNGMRGKAIEAARKAIDLDQGYNGKAYMILGYLWASASCGDVVDKWARYWVAVDYYQKARNADPSVSEDAASAIAQASKYFPEASEAFMYDLTKGQSYTVSCGGMSATTTVRVQ